MRESIIEMPVPPGIRKDGTVYQSRNRWLNGSLVRFFQDMILPVGGWARMTDSSDVTLGVLTGIPRAAKVWSRDDGTPIFCWGTTNRLQAVAGRTLYDISPGGVAATNVAVFPPATVIVTVGSLATSGATAGAATSIQIAATACSGTYNIGDMLLISGVLYTVRSPGVTIAANTALVPVSPAVGGGGIPGATAAVYYATIKRDTTIGASGGTYGNSTYSTGVYGIGATGANETPCDTWQIDVFGEQSAEVCTVDKVLYVNTGTAAATAAAGAPSCKAVVITPERYVTALYAAGFARRVQWADRESTSSWTASATNTAGSFDLKTEGKLMTGRRTKDETLLWTDCDVHAMRYIGGVFVYSFTQVGDHCGLIGPNAVSIVDTQAYWMGIGGFYSYDGYVHPLPSEVWDFVFMNINFAQRNKIWSIPVPQYGEIWWFYPSGMNTECDSYVVYNNRENHWSIGSLGRTAGWAANPWTYPVYADSTGAIYEHEKGSTRTGSTAYIESGPFELGPGDYVMDVQRIIPDVTSTSSVNDVTATIYSALYPNQPSGASLSTNETTNGPFTLVSPTNMRVTARQFRVKYTEANPSPWRIGKLKFGVRQRGRR